MCKKDISFVEVGRETCFEMLEFPLLAVILILLDFLK